VDLIQGSVNFARELMVTASPLRQRAFQFHGTEANSVRKVTVAKRF
jgi:hypothetical protein